MNREERAKQFLAFDALKGLREELSRREELALRIPRRKLSEEEAEKLSRRLSHLAPQDEVTVIYYDKGRYVQLTGAVLICDLNKKQLTVDSVSGKKREIGFCDIYRLHKI